jgi:hypothetical protein
MLKLSAAGIAAASLLALAGPASAAPAASDRGIAKVAEASPVRPAAASTAEAEEDTNCSRARRRLWIEGEGWIVRRITTCR